MLVATDLDGTFDWAVSQDPPPTVCISGRTWQDYDATARSIATTMPVYIRGAGAFGDREHAGQFKAVLIKALAVDVFYEDDPLQGQIISAANPDCKVVLRS